MSRSQPPYTSEPLIIVQGLLVFRSGNMWYMFSNRILSVRLAADAYYRFKSHTWKSFVWSTINFSESGCYFVSVACMLIHTWLDIGETWGNCIRLGLNSSQWLSLATFRYQSVYTESNYREAYRLSWADVSNPGCMWIMLCLLSGLRLIFLHRK